MSIYKNLYAGLGAGAVAAIIAVLVSLPLESPDDIVFNAASVGFAALIVGAVSGLIWHWMTSDGATSRAYIAGSVVLAIVVLVIASLAQTQFDDAVMFTVPLAIIVAVISTVGTPFAASNERLGNWSIAVFVVVAVGLSLALAGQGDQESGALSLPPPP
jgi:Na+/proline symporter